MNASRDSAAHVLVVDDQEANVLLVRRLLERCGIRHIQGTTDPEQAVELCADFDPDLVILDLNMPGLDGFELLRRLAPLTQTDRPVPILVLTGHVDPETKERALSSGARDVLTKPIDVDEVRLRVANLLESRRAEYDLQPTSTSRP